MVRNLYFELTEELGAGDLAQATNEFDPPYTHGVFVRCRPEPPVEAEDSSPPSG